MKFNQTATPHPMKFTVLTAILITLFITNLEAQQISFSGTWSRNTEKCNAGDLSINSIPVEITVKQDGPQIVISRTSKNKQNETITYTEKLNFDGALFSSVVKPGLNKKSTIQWSADHQSLLENSSYADDQGKKIQNKKENWILINDSKTLQIMSIMEVDGQSYPMTEVYDINK